MLEAAKKQRLQRQQQQKSRKKKSRHLNEHRKEFKGAKIKTWREVIEERELQKGTLILNKPKKTAEIPPADYPTTKRQESRRKKSQPEISGPLILKEPFPDYEPHEPVEDINRDSFMPLPPSKLDLDILIDGKLSHSTNIHQVDLHYFNLQSRRVFLLRLHWMNIQKTLVSKTLTERAIMRLSGQLHRRLCPLSTITGRHKNLIWTIIRVPPPVWHLRPRRRPLLCLLRDPSPASIPTLVKRYCLTLRRGHKSCVNPNYCI